VWSSGIEAEDPEPAAVETAPDTMGYDRPTRERGDSPFGHVQPARYVLGLDGLTR